MIEKDIARSRVAHDFLLGGNEMGDIIRKYDWSGTSLGSPDSWPQSLKTTISILLNSSYPMFVWWGKDLVNIYNDAYSPILGSKHPQALGESARKVWSEIWKQGIGERAKIVFQGKPTFDENLLLIMERKGYKEESYFTFSYSPVRDDDGAVSGLFCACTEETKKIISERSLTTLKEIISPAEKTEDSAYKYAAATLAKNNKDFPFAVFYKIENKESSAAAVAWAGINKEQEIFPARIDLQQPLPSTKDFCQAFSQNRIIVGENKGKFKKLPKGFWETQPSQFLYIPIGGSGKKQPIAIIWSALNPYREFDDVYRQFTQLVADQLSLELNNVRAFEEERKRAESLAELDKAKTVFFSNISHEFRTPLTLMLGPLEELMQEDTLDKKQQEILSVSHRNALRMQKLVNNLLDFSRIEAGRINAFYEPVNLSTFTIDLASSFRSAIEKEGIQFVVDCPSLPKEVWVDKDMWEKIVLNLLSNAYKYTLTGQILVRLREESGRVKLTIADSGVGIPANELDKIFDRFHRVQNIKGRNFEGTGIGLSLVKELVKLHEGSISVESKVDQGSSFFISIPYTNSRVDQKNQGTAKTTGGISSASFVPEQLPWSSEENEPATKESSNKKYILIADDNYDMRNYISRLLADEYETIAVADGKAAWMAFQRRLPDLVIADIMMPEMDGFELLDAIRNSERPAPVILLSARAGEEAVNEGLQKGADAYLVKPFSALQLKTMVLNRLLLKESQDKIEEREKTFREVLLQSPNIFLILKGENMVIEFVNEPLLRSWGKGWDILGKPLLEILPELKNQPFPRLLGQVYKTGEPCSGDEERAVIMKDGKAIDTYYNFVFQPVLGPEGTVSGITVMATDITEQVATRKKIEESKRQLQLITDAVPILISYVDKERKYRFNNKAYENWFGHAREEIHGKHMREVLGEKAYENLKPNIDQVLSGMPVHFESLIPYKDGGERYILADYIPDFGMQHDVLGFYVVVNDITESKKAENALRVSEEKYRRIFNSVDEGFSIVEVLFDESGNPVDHVILEANPSFEKNTGLKNPIGRKASELVPGIEQAWNDLYAKVIQTGEALRVEKFSAPLNRWFDVLVSRMGAAEQNMVTIVFSDITERKKAETILRESEERFRSLAREAPLFVWLTDEKLKTTFLNKTGLDYFNLDESLDIETLSWKKFIHPGDLDRVLTIMDESARKNKPYTLEMRLKNGITGKYRWFLDKGLPRYSGEMFTGFIGTSLDIHDRKEAEELLEQRVKERTEQLADKNAELEKQKKFVETILASSRDLIAVFDTQLRYISVNKEVEKLYNITAEEFKGKFVLDVYPQLKDSDTIQSLQRCLQGETIYDKELKSPLTGHSFQTYYVPLKNPRGEIYGAVVIGHDITDIMQVADKIKAKNEELEHSRSFLQQLIDSSVEYIAVLDRNLNFITVNRRFEESIGLRREQITGQYLFNIIPKIENTAQHESILKALNGVTIYLDKRRSSVNPNLYIDTYIIPFIQQNKVEAVIIMARDVTDIVRSELILEEKNTELENTISLLRRHELKDEQKNNFITMASHELKTPITSIKGYVQLLLTSFNKSGEEKPVSPLLLRSSLISVDKQITRLTRLISELLDLSKIETGTLELRKEKFSLNELAIATVEDILYTNTRHTINLFHDDHFNVEADKDRIEQAIINFLTNAIKYSPNSDRIDVWIKKAGKDHVELSVKDYGIGIDKKFHDKIFERFYRVEGKEEQTYPGFGIGLFITREIIERHQGTIKFESEKGKGSVFSFILPVSP